MGTGDYKWRSRVAIIGYKKGRKEVMECDETRSKLGKILRRVALPEVIAPRNGDPVYLT